MSILYNDGKGVFSQKSDYANGSGANSNFAADLDNDDDMDIVLVNGNSVSIFLNIGHGILEFASEYATGSDSWSGSCADLDCDGDLDLAVSHFGSHNVSVLFNNGDATFQSKVNYSFSYPAAVFPADFDSDGDPDIAIQGHYSTVSILFNQNRAALINFSDDFHVFGNVQKLKSQGWTFTISNDGLIDSLEVFDIISSDSAFTVDIHAAEIAAGDSIKVTVIFTPDEAKLYSATLTVRSDDAAIPEYEISLTGRGTERVVSCLPGPGDLNIIENSSIQMTFSGPMNANSLSESTLRVLGSNGARYYGTINYNETTHIVTFTSQQKYLSGEKIQVILTDGVKSADEIPLGGGYSFEFQIRSLFGQGIFDIEQSFNTDTYPYALAVGDVDGDRYTDLLAISQGQGSLTIYVNDQEWRLIDSVTVDIGGNPQNVLLGDVDCDGDNDIITINSSSNSISLWQNNGNLSFNNIGTFNTGRGPSGALIADVNNDGFIDVITANYSANTISVLLNNKGIGFHSAYNIISGSSPSALAIADINNDGALDVICSNKNNNNVFIYINQGSGTFHAPYPVTTGQAPNDLVCWDFNHDGYPDIAMANVSDNTVSVILGDGDGQFGSPQNIPVGNLPFALYDNDFDADGDIDLAVANFGSNNVHILANNGSGIFFLHDSITVGADPIDIIGLDISGSMGIIDLAVAHFSDHTLSILKNMVPSGTYMNLSLDSPGEQSGDIVFDYTIYNDQNDLLGLLCEFATVPDYSWQKASITGDTSQIGPDRYSGSLTWLSEIDIPAVDIKDVKFSITPYTDSIGYAYISDPFDLDNYHNQSVDISLTEIQTEYGDSIRIEYNITDITNDILQMNVLYQVENENWKSATLDRPLISIDSMKYSGSFHWLSNEDLFEQELPQARFAVTPTDGWHDGPGDTTAYFAIDNNTPPLIYLNKSGLQTEQSNDIVVPYQMTDLSNDTLSIEVLYTTNQGLSWNAPAIVGDLTQISPYNYNDSFVWNSNIDLPGADIADVIIKCVPKDDDTGQADSLFIHVDNNDTPTAILQDNQNELSKLIQFQLTLSDTENDSLAIKCTYELDGGEIWYLASIISDTVQLLPGENPIAVIWDSQQDIPEYSGYLWFKVRPFDNDPGAPDSIRILVDNLGVPVIQALSQPEGEQSGDIEIGYTIQDDESDLVNLECFYSTDSSTWQTTITSGILSNISAQNYEGNITWHSGSDLAGKDIERVWVKIIPADAHTGVGRSTYAFHVDNNQPPQISQSSYKSPLSGIVDISFQLQDEENDTLAIKAAYRTGAAAWGDMPEAVRTHDNYQDTLSWNTYHDLGFGEYSEVQVRLIPVDNDSGNSNISNSFDVHNYAGDYSGDININYDDLIVFAQAWYEQDLNKEIGPASGQPPLLIPQPDGVIDFEDLMVLVQQWNWSYDHPHMGKLLAKTKQSGHSAVSWSRDQVQRVEKAEAQTEYLWQKEYIRDKDVRILSSIHTHLLQLEQSEYNPWNHKFADQLVFHLDTTVSVLGYHITIEYDSEVLSVAETENMLLADQDGFTFKVIEPQKNTAQFNSIVLGRKMDAHSWSDGLLKLNITANQEKEVFLTYRWIIHDIRGSIISSGESSSTFYSYLTLPETYALHQNYPNPFNPSTTIRYQLPVAGIVQLDIYNTLGQRVISLVDQDQEAGYHSCQWDITASRKSFASGLYLMQLRVQGDDGSQFKQSKKILLLK